MDKHDWETTVPIISNPQATHVFCEGGICRVVPSVTGKKWPVMTGPTLQSPLAQNLSVAAMDKPGMPDLPPLLEPAQKAWQNMTQKALLPKNSNGGNFENRKPVGEFGRCESRMKERTVPTDGSKDGWRAGLSICLSVYLHVFLSIYIPMCVSICVRI